MNNLLNKLTWNFIKEKTEPNIFSYIESLERALKSVSQRSGKDTAIIEIAKRDLHEVRLGVKRLRQELTVLEEQVKVLEEEKKVLEELKNKEVV